MGLAFALQAMRIDRSRARHELRKRRGATKPKPGSRWIVGLLELYVPVGALGGAALFYWGLSLVAGPMSSLFVVIALGAIIYVELGLSTVESQVTWVPARELAREERSEL